MLGNPSVPAVALCVMALHEAAMASRPAHPAPEGARAPADGGLRRKSEPKRRLRRGAGPMDRLESIPEPVDVHAYAYAQRQRDDADDKRGDANSIGIGGHWKRKRRLRNALEPADSTPLNLKGQRKLSECKWYPQRDGCSNDPAYMPQEWLNDAAMLKPTSEACCSHFLGRKDCKLYPAISCEAGPGGAGPEPPTNADETSATCLWYPRNDGCTNDPDGIPPDLLNHPAMLKSTGEACCSQLLGREGCKLYPASGCKKSTSDVEASTSTSEAPTTCLWYPHRDGCSNDPNYIPNDPAMLKQTGEACCSHFMGKPDCKLYPASACEGESDGAGLEPTLDTAVSEQGATSSSEPLATCLWYPRQDGCTNDPDGIPPDLLNHPEMLKSTGEACCSQLLGREGCKLYPASGCKESTSDVDNVADSTPTSETPTTCLWYPHRYGCSNDPNIIPQDWLNDLAMLKQTGEACCLHFMGNSDCKLYPASGCEESTSDSVSVSDPAPATETLVTCLWYPRYDGCTNDPTTIPPDLVNHPEMLKSTGEACCLHFMGKSDCNLYPANGCEESTSDVESAAGLPPATETLVTCSWYPKYDGCSNDPENMPQDSAMLQATGEACCLHFMGKSDCNLYPASGCKESTSGNESAAGPPPAPETLVTCSWYPHYDGCSNDPEHAPQDPAMLKATGEACCLHFMGKSDCKLYPASGCNEGPAGSDLGPTSDTDVSSEPTSTSEALLSCQWYSDPIHRDGCGNNPDLIEDDWRGNPIILHPSAESCCDLFYPGKDCNHYADSRCAPAPASDASFSCLWYPDSRHRDGCANNPDMIEDDWHDNPLMLHTTAKSCCDLFYPGKYCKQYGDSRCGGETILSSCLWYPNPFYRDGCANNPDAIEDDWHDNPLMLHTTAEECCDLFYSGKTCKLYGDSRCPSHPMTESGQIEVVQSPDDSLSLGDSNTEACITPGWWVEWTNQDGCSNGEDYSEDWLAVPNMFFPSHEACCSYFFPGELCKTYDHGCTIDSTSFFGDCEDQWHPEPNSGVGCTNDGSGYPSSWKDDPDDRESFFFPTALECCQEYHDDGNCPVRDACYNGVTFLQITSSPTSGPTYGPNECMWHPTLEPGGAAQCDHSDSYPVSWRYPENSHTHLFGSHEECCRGAFGLDDCARVGICVTPSPTASPIQPTQSPSAMPTSDFFYVQHTSGLCVLDSRYPKPYYITTTFQDHALCCETSFAKDSCFASGPSDPPTSWWPTITPAPTTPYPTTTLVYFVDHFQGNCIENYSVGVPHYATTYEDFWSCCEHAHDPEKCLQDGPTRIPTSQPSREASALPSSPPSMVPSPPPSSEPSQAFHPTAMPTTFFWGQMMSITSVPTLRPTRTDCSNLWWHADTDPQSQGCTHLPSKSATLLFKSAEECCLHSFEGIDCSVRDDCNHGERVIFAQANLPQPDNTCDHLWHPDIDFDLDGCSNALAFPEGWKEPGPVTVKLVFNSSDECCQELYIERGYHCKIYSGCSTDSSTSHPTNHPTSASNIAPLSDAPCVFARWHMTTDFSKCSNSNVYDPNWLEEESAYFFDSPTECCLAVFNYEPCPIEDICDPEYYSELVPHREPASSSPLQTYLEIPTGIPTHSPLQRFNDLNVSPINCNTKSKRQCSKDAACAYDESRDICVMIGLLSEPEPSSSPTKPPTSGATPGSSCRLKSTRRKCAKDDRCTWQGSCMPKHSTLGDSTALGGGHLDAQTTGTSGSNCSGKWHPKTINDRRCSNSFDYPPVWDKDSEKYFFDSFERCCSVFYDGRCAREDFCGTPSTL
ncbi:hypothetical protein ACHAWF_018765 [Thalassiosira exigua]